MLVQGHQRDTHYYGNLTIVESSSGLFPLQRCTKSAEGTFYLMYMFSMHCLGIIPFPVLRCIFLGIVEWLSARFSDSELGPQSAQGDACSDSEKCLSVCGDSESGTSTIAGADAWSTVVPTGWSGALTRNRLWSEALQDGVNETGIPQRHSPPTRMQ